MLLYDSVIPIFFEPCTTQSSYISLGMSPFELYLQTLELIQMMDRHKRKIGDHTLYESEKWRIALSVVFDLDIITNSIFISLKKCFRLDLVLPVIDKTCRFLYRWFENYHIPMTSCTWVNHRVSSDYQSIHIPLNRFLGLLIHSCVENGATSIENSIFPQDLLATGFIHALVDFPLRIQSWNAQINSGAWSRNGLSLRRMTDYFLSKYWYDLGLDVDIFLQQIGACLLPPETFLTLLLDRFECLEYFRLSQTSVRERDQLSDEHVVNVATDALSLLIKIVTDRSRAGLSKEQILRRDIVHWLAYQDLPYSELDSKIASRISAQQSFDEILRQVSDHQAPTGSSMGIYKLKSECWTQVSAYFLHYSKQQREEIQERYLEWSSSQASTRENIQKSRYLPIRPLQPIFQAMSKLSSILMSPIVHHIVFIVLLRAIENERIPEAQIAHSLYLFGLAVDESPPVSESDRVVSSCALFTSSNPCINAAVVTSASDKTIIDMLLDLKAREEYKVIIAKQKKKKDLTLFLLYCYYLLYLKRERSIFIACILFLFLGGYLRLFF